MKNIPTAAKVEAPKRTKMAIVEVPRSSPSVLLELALNRSARGDCDDPDTTAASLATAVAAAPSVSIEPGRYAERCS